MVDHTYRTTDPAALAAYRAAVAARDEFTTRLLSDITILGAGKLRPLSREVGFGGPVEICGLQYQDDAHVPWGWRVVSPNGNHRLEPKPSGAGSAAAKRWLAEHQPGPACDPRYVLKTHGITYQSRIHTSGGGFRTYTPAVFEYDDALWVWYRDGDPDADFPGEPCQITWEQVPLADMQKTYAAAYEAATTGRVKETV